AQLGCQRLFFGRRLRRVSSPPVCLVDVLAGNLPAVDDSPCVGRDRYGRSRGRLTTRRAPRGSERAQRHEDLAASSAESESRVQHMRKAYFSHTPSPPESVHTKKRWNASITACGASSAR